MGENNTAYRNGEDQSKINRFYNAVRAPMSIFKKFILYLKVNTLRFMNAKSFYEDVQYNSMYVSVCTVPSYLLYTNNRF